MFRLDCSVQSYAWGKNGTDSAVAKLKGASDSTFTVLPEQNYAG